MADFDYLAIDTRGNETRGHVTATDMDAARAALDRKRLYVVRLDPGSTPQARTRPLFGLELGRAKMSGKQLTLFTRQLATLNRVSPLEESLRTITRQTEQESVRAIVQTVHGAVVEGRRLADAMPSATFRAVTSLPGGAPFSGNGEVALAIVVDWLNEHA